MRAWCVIYSFDSNPLLILYFAINPTEYSSCTQRIQQTRRFHLDRISSNFRQKSAVFFLSIIWYSYIATPYLQTSTNHPMAFGLYFQRWEYRLPCIRVSCSLNLAQTCIFNANFPAKLFHFKQDWKLSVVYISQRIIKHRGQTNEMNKFSCLYESECLC